MPDDIVVHDENNLATQTTEISWEPGRDLTYEEWYQVGMTLNLIGRAMNWWIGDHLNYGEDHFGESFSQIIDDHLQSIPTETLKKLKAVARRYHKSRRVPELSWSHHFRLAYTEPAIADKILAIAEEYSLSVRDVGLIAQIPDKESFFLFVDNQIQLRQEEVMREAYRLLTPPPIVDNNAEPDDDDDIPFTDRPAEVDDADNYAWLPDDDPMDSVRLFFLERGIPIVHDDENLIEWRGGIRLSVQMDGNRPVLTWEVTVR